MMYTQLYSASNIGAEKCSATRTRILLKINFEVHSYLFGRFRILHNKQNIMYLRCGGGVVLLASDCEENNIILRGVTSQSYVIRCIGYAFTLLM